MKPRHALLDIISASLGLLTAVLFLWLKITVYPFGSYLFAPLSGFVVGIVRGGERKDVLRATTLYLVLALAVMLFVMGWADRVYQEGSIRTIDILFLQRIPIPRYPVPFYSLLIGGGYIGALVGDELRNQAVTWFQDR